MWLVSGMQCWEARACHGKVNLTEMKCQHQTYVVADKVVVVDEVFEEVVKQDESLLPATVI